MKKYILIACISWGMVFSQDSLSGIIKYQENNKVYPLKGANVFWQNTTVGTVTDVEGNFQLQRVSDTDWLIISYIGFKTDTLKVETPFISHKMTPNEVDELAEVKLIQRRKEIQKSYVETQNIIKVSSEELLKLSLIHI